MITDEMVEAAGAAWSAAISNGAPPSIERGIRAALEAVLPMIRAAALEEAAKVVESQRIDLSGPYYADPEDYAEDEARVAAVAAIRAMKGTRHDTR